jgi:dolichol-phosphate mannosyltransferase
LRFAIYLGAIISLVAVIGAIWILLGNLTGKSELVGWSGLMLTLFFFNGTLLIVIGLVGVYIGKIFQQVKARPLFVISEKI